jgi:hypothetical protein
LAVACPPAAPALENLQNDLFTPASWLRLTERIEFIPDESAGMIAEDESANVYNFGTQGFPQSRPALPADEWLGVSPDAPHAYDEWSMNLFSPMRLLRISKAFDHPDWLSEVKFDGFRIVIIDVWRIACDPW